MASALPVLQVTLQIRWHGRGVSTRQACADFTVSQTCERYNRSVRYDWLSQYPFDSIDEVQEFATKWVWTYNHERAKYGARRHHTHAEINARRLLHFWRLLKMGITE